MTDYNFTFSFQNDFNNISSSAELNYDYIITEIDKIISVKDYDKILCGADQNNFYLTIKNKLTALTTTDNNNINNFIANYTQPTPQIDLTTVNLTEDEFFYYERTSNNNTALTVGTGQSYTGGPVSFTNPGTRIFITRTTNDASILTTNSNSLIYQIGQFTSLDPTVGFIVSPFELTRNIYYKIEYTITIEDTDSTNNTSNSHALIRLFLNDSDTGANGNGTPGGTGGVVDNEIPSSSNIIYLGFHTLYKTDTQTLYHNYNVISGFKIFTIPNTSRIRLDIGIANSNGRTMHLHNIHFILKRV